LVIALLAIARLGGEGTVTKLEAEVISPQDPVDCSQPVPITIHVRITTDGEATVNRAGGPEEKTLTQQFPLAFSQKETKEHDLPVRNLRPHNGVIEVNYTVVTNEPNIKKSHAMYKISC